MSTTSIILWWARHAGLAHQQHLSYSMTSGPSLVSDTVGSLKLVIRIRASVDDGAVTTQGCTPSLAVLPDNSVHGGAPPLRDSSIFTLPVRPVEVHVM